MNRLLMDLNEAQRAAVQHVEGPLLVLAGPGTGKTRVVTHRVAWLLEEVGVRGSSILALTFTNKAAEEMRSRVERLVPGEQVWMGTFHRFCARMLRRYAHLVGLEPNYTIYDVPDSRRVLRRALDDERFRGTYFTADQIAREISRAKNGMATPEQYAQGAVRPLAKVTAELFPLYQARLLQANAVDFDDLLLHFGRLLTEHDEVRAELDATFRYVMVDEYQDTNLAQYQIVRGLSVDFPNLAVTGDPDQSIYSWRGANVRNILEFERDYPQAHVVRLEQNYRSTPQILRTASALISHNQRRKPKELFTENSAGDQVHVTRYFTNRDEAEQIADRIATALEAGVRRPRDFAIFYRVNALSRTLETALGARGVPYQVVQGVEFFERTEIKDLVSYLQLLNNPRNDAACLRVINVPTRGIGKGTVQRLIEHADARGLPLLAAAREAGLVRSLSKRAAVAVARFVALIDALSTHLAQPVEEILERVLETTAYQTPYLESDDEEDIARLDNIGELVSAAREYDQRHPEDGSLEGFLEQASLVNDVDAWESEDDRVTLMTLHAAKGLEFPVVHVVGIEEGLLPHERCRDHLDQIEEERRLLFVGITRAREESWLSFAERRESRGQARLTIPSQFLAELPVEALTWGDPGAARAVAAEAGREASRGSLARPAEPRACWTESLTTAAHLGGQEPPPGVASMGKLLPGVRVRHPEYGAGLITQLTGTGPLQAALVQFDTAVGPRKFILQHCRSLVVDSDDSSSV